MKINRLFLGITLIFILSSCNQLKDSISNHFSTDINTQKMQRYALIIGNANYITNPNIRPLRNPVNDARDMKKNLGRGWI